MRLQRVLIFAGGRRKSNIGFGCNQKIYQKRIYVLKISIEAFSKLKGLKIENRRSFVGYGTFAMNVSNKQDGRLVVGEAAGFQDLFLGFGMKYALLSGYAAAKSIMEEKDYDMVWRELVLDKQKSICCK